MCYCMVHMKPELEQYLIKKYPKIYTEIGSDQPFALFGFECNDGWFRLILWLSKYIQEYTDMHNKWAEKFPNENHKPVPQVKIMQVKEKFGTLRYYYHGGDEKISAVVDFVEMISANICESTGKTDNIGHNKSGWIKTHHKDLTKGNDFYPNDDEELRKILDT